MKNINKESVEAIDYNNMEFKEIKTLAEMNNALILVKKLYPHLGEDEIISAFNKKDLEKKFFLIKYKKKFIAYYSFSIRHSLVFGKSLYIEDIIIDEQFRKLGIASKIFKDIEISAKNNKVNRMDLISYNSRLDAHKFWKSRGFECSAKYFKKEL